MVAKSFQEMEIVCEPYTLNGRMYVKVKNPKTGTTRQVRWYTDSEYAKLYPEAKADITTFKDQKQALGFEKGYITIFKGDTYTHIDWFRASICRYTRWWGWYVVSTEEIPEDLPSGVEPVRLDWESVGAESGNLKPESQVKEAVEALIYEGSDSEHVGTIGERIEVYVTVEKALEFDGAYGRSSTMHLMRDDCGNLYVWNTSAKSWSVGTEHHIRGTVKDHRTYRNEKQTVLNRCQEI